VCLIRLTWDSLNFICFWKCAVVGFQCLCVCVCVICGVGVHLKYCLLLTLPSFSCWWFYAFHVAGSTESTWRK
jgi:hypothetical protein